MLRHFVRLLESLQSEQQVLGKRAIVITLVIVLAIIGTTAVLFLRR